MKNFQLIVKGVDFSPILDAITKNSALWNYFNLRTTHPGTPHSEVDDIVIRFNKIRENMQEYMDDSESVWYSATQYIPVQPFITTLMASTMADRIGRVVITRLRPGGKIESHKDLGAPVSYYQRFHFAILNEPGAKFICGDEEYTPDTGDIFIFDNSKEHSVVNDSDTDRITMIVDLHTPFFEHIKTTIHDEKPYTPKVKEYQEGITYQVEELRDVIEELKPFAPIHWAELGLTKDDVPLDMDWERYLNLEKDGRLHLVVVRDNGKVIGYQFTFVGGHFHETQRGGSREGQAARLRGSRRTGFSLGALRPPPRAHPFLFLTHLL